MLHLISKFPNVMRMRNVSDLATFEHQTITNQLITLSLIILIYVFSFDRKNQEPDFSSIDATQNFIFQDA